MKTYLIVKKQRGKGCDYTIGCGTTAEVVEADSWNEALLQAINADFDWKDQVDEIIARHDTYESISDTLDDWLTELPDLTGEYSLESIKVYEVSKIFDAKSVLQTVHDYVENAKAKLESTQEEDEERELYLQLKKKFEK